MGAIQLVLSKAKSLPTEGKENVFGLITPARTYLLQVMLFIIDIYDMVWLLILSQADSAPEVNSWVECLSETCEALASSSPDILKKSLDSVVPGSIKVYHEGVLLKEGNAIVKDWKKRYFILEGESLTYYKKKGVSKL